MAISMLGRKMEDGRVIKIRTVVTARYPAGDSEEIQDDSLAPGETKIERKAINGLRVTLYRDVYNNGKLSESEKLTEDYYRPVRGKIRINKNPFM